jgi:hypothetical protein
MKVKSGAMGVMEIEDIKPYIDSIDWTLYLSIFLVIVGLTLLVYLVRFLLKKIKIREEKNTRKIYLEVLNNIDWSNPKKAAYEITECGRVLATDDKQKELFANLLVHLQKYKYKKVVDESIDSKTMREFEIFKQVCNESI